MQTAKTSEINKLISITPDIKPAYKKINSYVSDLLFIKQGSVLHKIKLEDILYLESDNVYIYVCTATKKYLVRSTINQYLELLGSSRFFRIHRSYAINIAHVETIDSNHVFINNHPLPLAKTYRDDLLDQLRIG